MEARGFECAFSGALMIFGWSMSNNNIRRYQDSQIKPIPGPFRCGAVLKIWDQNRCLVLYGEDLKSLTNSDHLFSDSLRLRARNCAVRPLVGPGVRKSGFCQ
jgi:hypothetical protein